MKQYTIKVTAIELVTVVAENEDQAIEKACDKFGENIQIQDNAEIIESGKEF